MNKPFLWVLVATMGLAGCGGGGGGGGGGGSPNGPEPNPNPGEQQVTTAQLAGTWMKITETRNGEEWVSSRRQTFTITRTNNTTVNLKDCFEGAGSNWTLSNGTLTRSGQTALTVANAEELTASAGNTQIRWVKLDSNTTPVVADVTIYSVAGLDMSEATWSPVCLDTFVADGAPNELWLKVSGQYEGVSGAVTLKIVSSQSFLPSRLIDYPAANPADDNITGSFSATYMGVPVTGTLSAPLGEILVNEDYMDFDLVMESSHALVESVDVWGFMTFDPEWLAQPEL